MKMERSFVILGIVFSVIAMSVVVTTADWSAGVSAFIVAMALLSILPLGLVTLMGWFLRKSKPALITCLIALIIAFGFMTLLYVDAFYIHPDAQGGLILLFGPFYTLLGLIPFGIVALVLFVRGQREQGPEAT